MPCHDKLAKLPLMSLLVRLISLITVISLGSHCASRQMTQRFSPWHIISHFICLSLSEVWHSVLSHTRLHWNYIVWNIQTVSTVIWCFITTYNKTQSIQPSRRDAICSEWLFCLHLGILLVSLAGVFYREQLV